MPGIRVVCQVQIRKIQAGRGKEGEDGGLAKSVVKVENAGGMDWFGSIES